MNLNNEYKELYYKSLEHRQQLNSKIVPILTMITATLAAVVWMVMNWVDGLKERTLILSILSGILITTSSLIVVYIIIGFWRLHGNYTCTRISPEKIKSMVDENKEYLKYYSVEEIEKNMMDNLSEAYIKAAIENYNENINRGKYQTHLFVALIINMLLMIFAFMILLL